MITGGTLTTCHPHFLCDSSMVRANGSVSYFRTAVNKDYRLQQPQTSFLTVHNTLCCTSPDTPRSFPFNNSAFKPLNNSVRPLRRAETRDSLQIARVTSAKPTSSSTDWQSIRPIGISACRESANSDAGKAGHDPKAAPKGVFSLFIFSRM